MPKSSLARLILAVLTLATLAGCSKPAEGYALVSRQSAEADGGRYAFDLTLDEASYRYATTLTARLNTARLDQQELTLQLSVTSPTGTTAIERIAFPLNDADGKVRSRRDEGGVRDYRWPWRENIRVEGSDVGTWRIVVTIPDATQWQAVEGLGLSYQGIPWEKEN